MGNLGVPEILIIVLLVLVFFGAKKIPEMAQGLGKGIREFRKATREVQDDIESATKITTERPQQPAKVVAGKLTDASTGVLVSCYFCNADVMQGAKFCPSCGKSLAPPKCSACSTENPVGSKFCKECGTKLPG